MSQLETTQQAQLTAFERLDPYTYAVKFTCWDRAKFDEILYTIKSFPVRFRTWDPDTKQWNLDTEVCEALFEYLPALRHRMKALELNAKIKNRDTRPDNR